MRKILSTVAAVAMGLTAASLALAETTVISGGRVVTGGPAGTIDGGTVVIEDGRITAVGLNIAVPDGATMIDATGKWVTVGVMNAFTTLGISEIGLEGSTRDDSINSPSPFNRSTTKAPFSAAFDISYAFNPKSVYIPISRIEGMTRAVIVPSSGAATFGGQAAVIDLSGDWDSVVAPRAAQMASYGSGGKGKNGGSRAATMTYLRVAFAEAARVARRGARAMPGRERDSLLTVQDAQALGPVVAGDVPLYVSANRASDLLQLAKLKADFDGLRIIVLGAAEGWMVADQLAEADIAVVINPVQNMPSNFDALASTQANAGRLAAAGVTVALAAPDMNSGSNARLILQGAGIAVAAGMNWDDAFAAITSVPAALFGIGGEYGTLEPGKDADVVIWNGDPLEVMTSPDAVFIRGVAMAMESRQTRLRDRYLQLGGDMPHAYRK